MANLLNSLKGFLGNLGSTAQKILDKIAPPEQRAEMLAKLQAFAMGNPKLAAFLLTQFALTGLPLVLFLTFTLTVFIFALLVALILGLLAAVIFTVGAVLVALIIVLPTIFLTTFAASFIFLWGLGGYYLLKWFNEGEVPAPEGTAIGDKLNSLTGGRMSWLMDGTRKKAEDAHTGVDQTPKVHSSEEKDGDSAPNNDKSVNQAKEQATKQTDGVQKRVSKTTNGATHSPGTAKGADE